MKIIMAVLLLSILAISASAKVNVVATSTDLADIAKSVGGDRVSVTTLMVGTQNPHAVEPRPSQVVKLRNADMVVRIGMDLDMWADSLIEAARNRNINRGGKGYVDASKNVRKLEVPSGKVDASHGDIHVYGNPHYWLDPENAKIVARTLLAGLKRVALGDAAYFEKNCNAFEGRIDKEMKGWATKMAPFKGRKVVTYHKTWIYFLRRFGLVEFDTVEAKPGISPSPSHLRGLIAGMKRENVDVILMEPFYSEKFPKMIARETGAKIVKVPTSVGGAKGITNYFDLMDKITDSVARGLK